VKKYVSCGQFLQKAIIYKIRALRPEMTKNGEQRFAPLIITGLPRRDKGFATVSQSGRRGLWYI
jgi:hypothetical protein